MCESCRGIATLQSLTSSTFQVATTNNRGCVYNREGDRVSARSERPGQISEKPPCFRSGPIFGHHTYLRTSITNSSLPALARAMTEMVIEMKMFVMMSLRIVIIMMILVTMVRKWHRSLVFFTIFFLEKRSLGCTGRLALVGSRDQTRI